MKPVYATETITRKYWICSVKGHRHKTEAAAQNCIDRGPSRDWTELKRARQRRHQEIVSLVICDKATPYQAAELVGLSGTRGAAAMETAIRVYKFMVHKGDAEDLGETDLASMRRDPLAWSTALTKALNYGKRRID